jgi:hypothetical protein
MCFSRTAHCKCCCKMQINLRYYTIKCYNSIPTDNRILFEKCNLSGPRVWLFCLMSSCYTYIYFYIKVNCIWVFHSLYFFSPFVYIKYINVSERSVNDITNTVLRVTASRTCRPDSSLLPLTLSLLLCHWFTGAPINILTNYNDNTKTKA